LINIDIVIIVISTHIDGFKDSIIELVVLCIRLLKKIELKELKTNYRTQPISVHCVTEFHKQSLLYWSESQ